MSSNKSQAILKCFIDLKNSFWFTLGSEDKTMVRDAVLKDFRGKVCAFVANWLRGKALNKLCAVFEVFKF